VNEAQCVVISVNARNIQKEWLWQASRSLAENAQDDTVFILSLSEES
jgi:hypothetical protein